MKNCHLQVSSYIVVIIIACNSCAIEFRTLLDITNNNSTFCERNLVNM